MEQQTNPPRYKFAWTALFVVASSCGEGQSTGRDSVPVSGASAVFSVATTPSSAAARFIPEPTAESLQAVFKRRYGVGAEDVLVVRVPSNLLVQIIADRPPNIGEAEVVTLAYSTGDLADRGAHPPPGREESIEGQFAYVVVQHDRELISGGLLVEDPTRNGPPWTAGAVPLSSLLD